MEYNLKKISQQDIQVIMAGLGELPIKVGINTLMRIQQQVDNQDKIAAVPLKDLGLSEAGPEAEPEIPAEAASAKENDDASD